MHRLRQLFADAADGRFPDVDGEVEVLVTDRVGHLAIIEFTGHSVVLVDEGSDVEEFRREITRLGADGFGGASHPSVTTHLAGRRSEIGTQDAFLVSHGRGETPSDVGLRKRLDLDQHPRVVRSREHRADVQVFGDDTGLVTLGWGVGGRLEVAVELTTPHGVGNGRRLIDAAVGVAPGGVPVWAQVAPGNAASLRAFLASGFVPVGSETLVVRH